MQFTDKLLKDIYVLSNLEYHHTPELPDYDCYLLQYNGMINSDWLSKHADGKKEFVILVPYTVYDNKWPGITFLTYINWHRYVPVWKNTEIKYRFSLDSTHPNQSSTWILTQIAKQKQILINHLPEKLVELPDTHTGNILLDELAIEYIEQHHNVILNSDSYTSGAIHLATTDFPYSHMVDQYKPYIHPGPLITDNMLTCLYQGVGFIPCGQYKTLETLQEYGFIFEYDFDTSWDLDSGNLTRFSKICKLLESFLDYTIDDLLDATQKTTEFNQYYATSNEFYQICEQQNDETVALILDKYVN